MPVLETVKIAGNFSFGVNSLVFGPVRIVWKFLFRSVLHFLVVCVHILAWFMLSTCISLVQFILIRLQFSAFCKPQSSDIVTTNSNGRDWVSRQAVFNWLSTLMDLMDRLVHWVHWASA